MTRRRCHLSIWACSSSRRVSRSWFCGARSVTTLSTPAQKVSGSMSVPGSASLWTKSCNTRATRRFPTVTRSVILPPSPAINSSYPSVTLGRSAGHREQQLTTGKQRVAQGRGALVDNALATHIFRAPGGVLDRDRFKSVAGQVVGAGPHVEFAGRRGEFEAVQQQLRVGQRAELAEPFVQIHVRVKAPGLFGGRLGGPRRGAVVARCGGRGEEAECVEVA